MTRTQFEDIKLTPKPVNICVKFPNQYFFMTLVNIENPILGLDFPLKFHFSIDAGRKTVELIKPIVDKLPPLQAVDYDSQFLILT